MKQSLLLREFLDLERRATTEKLDVVELERWRGLKRSIETRLGTRPPTRVQEARKSLRIPLALKVVFSTQEELTTSLLHNLSRGGFLIETKEPLPVGTVFRACVEVVEWRLEVTPLVRVVSHNIGPDLTTAAQGMGVAFHNLNAEERRTVDAIYDLCLGAAVEGREIPSP